MAFLDQTGKPGAIQHVKGVLFGPPKTGKTTAATRDSGKTLLVEMEPEGDLAIVGREHVDVVKPSGWSDINDTLAELYTTHADRWDTVVFDSVTFMFELLVGKQLAKTLQEDKDPRRLYLKAGTAMNQIIRDAVNLPMNVVFISQMKIDSGDDDSTALNPQDGEYPLTLALTPMVYKVLAPAVSFLGRTYKKVGLDPTTRKRTPEYWTSFEDHGRSPAGSRFPIESDVKDFSINMLRKEIS